MSGSNHYVVAGGGRVGRRVAAHFADRGHPITVIDRDSETIDAWNDSADFEYVTGDATRPSVLREAFSERTTVLGALTDRRDTNLAICMAAKQLDGDLRTVARIDDEGGDEYTEFVDEVYFPERASVEAAVNALSGSDVRTLEGVTGDLRVFDVRVDYDAPAASEVVSDVLPAGSVVISRTHGDVAVQHSTKLVGGRRYIVAADPDVAEDVVRQFRGDPER